MRKNLNQMSTYGRPTLRGVAAISFTLALTLGCTTNKMPGDGQPIRSPDVGPPNLSATPGSSSGTSPVPPGAAVSAVSHSKNTVASLAADRSSGSTSFDQHPIYTSSLPSPLRVSPARMGDFEMLIDPSDGSGSGSGGGGATAGNVAMGATVAAAPAASGVAASASAGGKATTGGTVNGNLMAGATVVPGSGATGIAGGTPAPANITPSINTTAIGVVSPVPQPANIVAPGVTPALPIPANIAGPGVAPAASTNISTVTSTGSTTGFGTVSAKTSTTVSAGMVIARPFTPGVAAATFAATPAMISSSGRIRAVRPTGGGVMIQPSTATRTIRPGGPPPSPRSELISRTRVAMPPVGLSRIRPIRVTTTTDGTLLVTNVSRE